MIEAFGRSANRSAVPTGSGPMATRSPSTHHRSTPATAPSATTASRAIELPWTSEMIPSATCGLRLAGVERVGVDPVVGDRLVHVLGLGVAGLGQRVQHGHHDVAGVDLEVVTQLLAVVAAAVAVGAQGGEVGRHPAG